MQTRLTLGLLIAPAFLVVPSLAAAKGDQSARVFASIDESCQFIATDVALADGTTYTTGIAEEACNSARGFTITANTRPLASDELVKLRYASGITSLEIDGSTVIARIQGASVRRVPFAIEANRLLAPLTLSLSMSAV